jgi:DNA processing protein
VSETPPFSDRHARLAAIALAFVEGVGCVAYRERVARSGSAAAAFMETVPPLEQEEALTTATRILGDAERVGARLLMLGEPDYPPALLDLRDPPPFVFTLGTLAVLTEPAVAIVGTRHASPAGERIAHRLAVAIVRAGGTVVSGLARGVDAAAHRGALEAGGSTIAVLGCGVDIAFPAANRALYEEIAARGLLISEAPPGVRPIAGAFPRRNRLIAALGRAVIVVEAGDPSGALITANHALELGRGVGAVPGSIEAPQSVGSNHLLHEGATIITSTQDALLLVGLSSSVKVARSSSNGERKLRNEDEGVAVPMNLSPWQPDRYDPREAAVLQAVQSGASDLSDVVHRTGLAPRDIAGALAALELAGVLWTDHAGAVRITG